MPYKLKKKKKGRKLSIIKKPQGHQDKIAGTLFKQPEVRKYVIKQSHAYAALRQDLSHSKPLSFLPVSATFCHTLKQLIYFRKINVILQPNFCFFFHLSLSFMFLSSWRLNPIV